jgi:hypothetical protein
MKTKFSYVIGFFLVFALTAGLGSCRSGKNTLKKDSGRSLDLPCQEKRRGSGDGMLGATDLARSSDLAFSKEKAIMATQARLASLVEGSVRRAAQRYADESQSDHRFDMGAFDQAMTVTASNTVLHMSQIVCEETFVKGKGRDKVYTTYVRIAIPKEELFDGIMSRQNKAQYFEFQERIDEFRDIFEEETQRLQNW